MADKHLGYMTTFKERLSYWTYFIGQNIYYNITAAFISTYLAGREPCQGRYCAADRQDLGRRE